VVTAPAPDLAPELAAGEAGELALPALPPLSRPVRIVVAGDSTADATGAGLLAWAAANPDLAQAELVTAPGCGFLTGGQWELGDEIVEPVGCEDWVAEFLLPTVERVRPDVVMAMVTSWDLRDRRWDTEALLTPLDDAYAQRLRNDYAGLVGDLLAAGAGHVALVRHPRPDPWWLPAAGIEEDPARHAVIYAVYDDLAAADPDHVSVVRLDDYFMRAGIDRDQQVRPDGIHVAPAPAERIAAEFLGDRLMRIALGVPVR
jgi:hypothetical protein